MRVTALKEVHYDPSVFLNVETVDEAVQIILTPEAGLTSQQRWQNEAPFLMGIIEKCIPDLHNQCILDWGCGIGRMAKPLIEKHACTVIGVDISPNMRALAASCVGSNDFFALAPELLCYISEDTFSGALAIWTLQHVLDLDDAISRIHFELRPGGWFFVVNNHKRAIPSNAGPWLDDGKDVNAEIYRAGFECLKIGRLEGADIAGSYLAKETFWAFYRKT